MIGLAYISWMFKGVSFVCVCVFVKPIFGGRMLLRLRMLLWRRPLSELESLSIENGLNGCPPIGRRSGDPERASSDSAGITIKQVVVA